MAQRAVSKGYKGKPQPPQPQPPPITILDRRTVTPVNLGPGKKVGQRTVPGQLLHDIDLTTAQSMIASEAIIFSMMFEGRRAIGGFVLEQVAQKRQT